MLDPAPPIPAGNEEAPLEAEADEPLYFRIPPLGPDEPDLDVVTLDDVPSRSFSVNLGSLSNPEDVIADYPGWGIATFPASAFPHKIVSPGDVTYEFHLIPKVEDGNLAHADVQVLKNGKEVDKITSETVKAQFREHIRGKAKLLRKPDRG